MGPPAAPDPGAAVPVQRALVLACLPRTRGRTLARVLASTGLVGSVDAHLSPRHGLPLDAALARARADVSATGTCSIRLRWPSVAQLRAAGVTPDQLFGVPTAWVLLTAQDRFAQAVAWDLAEARRHEARSSYDFPRLAGRFADLCAEETGWDRWLAEHGVTPLLVTREAVRRDVVAVAREVLAHVGLPSLRPIEPPGAGSTPDHREAPWTEQFVADLAQAAHRDDPSAA